jgi:hypothetical protein
MSGTLPELNEHRLLPEGVHDATLDEVASVFGSFQRTSRRPTLFAELRRYVEQLRNSGWGFEIFVDGSFVMGEVDEPNDVDLVLVLSDDWDMTHSIRPFEYNLLSRKRVRREFGFDLFLVRANSTEYDELLEFFQQVRPERARELGLAPGVRKGIVRILE